ncbi:hypothetical protein ACTWPP_00205 [Actinomadura sp. 3N407]
MTRTRARTHNVVEDTAQSLRDMRTKAVNEAGSIVHQVSPAGSAATRGHGHGSGAGIP